MIYLVKREIPIASAKESFIFLLDFLFIVRINKFLKLPLLTLCGKHLIRSF